MKLGDKFKLLKLSRSCSKKTLERYFYIDSEQETLVYYGKEADKKPKKSVSLEKCKVGFERLSQYRNEVNKNGDNKVSRWVEEDKEFRLKISVQAREFQPVYHYTESFHQAIGIKVMIDRLFMSQDQK